MPKRKHLIPVNLNVNNMAIKQLKLGFLFILLLIPVLFLGQGGPKLFLTDEPLGVIIRFNFDSVYREPCAKPAYHAGELELETKEVFQVKVRKRGKFRCDQRNCPLAPLMVDFEKKQVKNTIFNHQNKLKLVMPCKPKSDKYNQYLFKEYLVYKLLNSLTPMSFNVRLLELKLVNTAPDSDTVSIPAFLIEDDDAMAVRNQGSIWKASGISAISTQREYMTLVDLFQYMVGNTDWSVTEPHNIELVSTDPFQPPYAVPYDFDWCGFVSAPYATPNPKLGLMNVRQRLYMGYCRSDEEWKQAFQLFRDKRDAILQSISQFPLANETEKKRMIRYLSDFEEIVNDPPAGIKQLRRECLDQPE